MKAATGELNLTVITLIAIAAVLGFFWYMWPQIQNSINNQWQDINEKKKKKTNNTTSGYIVPEYFFEK